MATRRRGKAFCCLRWVNISLQKFESSLLSTKKLNMLCSEKCLSAGNHGLNYCLICHAHRTDLRIALSGHMGLKAMCVTCVSILVSSQPMQWILLLSELSICHPQFCSHKRASFCPSFAPNLSRTFWSEEMMWRTIFHRFRFLRHHKAVALLRSLVTRLGQAFVHVSVLTGHNIL